MATKNVVDVIANSTPFLREDKIENYREERRQLTGLANDLIFLNPHGYTHYYKHPNIKDFQNEVNRILQAEWLLWKHWPGLLIVEDVKLPEPWDRILAPLYGRGYVHSVSLNDLPEIKGLEYQHVFILLSIETFQEIEQGFRGSGRKTYDERRLLRIPFSRAKDSLVTFALP